MSHEGRNGRAIFSLPNVTANEAGIDLQLSEDTPHAYDRNRIDRSRDAGRHYGYRCCADILHNDFIQRDFSKQHEMLGQRPKQVRNETPSTTGSASSSTGTSGTSTTSSAPLTGAGSTSSATRPAEAAGLPDCRH